MHVVTSPQNDTSEGKEPWADVADKLSQAIAIYSKAGTSSDPGTTYPLLSYLYTRAILRHASLLLSILSAKGWGPAALSKMFETGKPNFAGPTSRNRRDNRISLATLTQASASIGLARSDIAAVVSQAHGPWLLHLDSRERISVLEAIASVYGSLHFRRKEAYILREVLGSVMDLVVCGRDEVGGARVNGAGLGFQGVTTLSNAKRGAVGVRENDSIEGNDSVLRIVKYVCGIHGINLQSVKLFDGTGRPLGQDNNTADSVGSPLDIVDEEEDELAAFLDPFGWPELQMGIIREAVAVAEALPGVVHSTSQFQFGLTSGQII